MNNPYQQKWATTKSMCRGGRLQTSTCRLVPSLALLYLADLHYLGAGITHLMLQIYLGLACNKPNTGLLAAVPLGAPCANYCLSFKQEGVNGAARTVVSLN